LPEFNTDPLVDPEWDFWELAAYPITVISTITLFIFGPWQEIVYSLQTQPEAPLEYDYQVRLNTFLTGCLYTVKHPADAFVSLMITIYDAIVLVIITIIWLLISLVKELMYAILGFIWVFDLSYQLANTLMNYYNDSATYFLQYWDILIF